MKWLPENPEQVWELTLEHLYLSIVPVVLGLALALVLGLVFGNRRRARTIITTVASAVFTVPSLALFVVMPTLLGTQILDPINVVVALSLYSTSLLVRTVFDALDAVPADVLNAAEAMGYSPARRRLLVDLPLAVAPLAAGTRVATVTSVSLVSVGAVIGIGGLGQLFTSGYQRDYPDQILAGIIMILLLALVLDRVVAGIGQLLTPWLSTSKAGTPASAAPAGTERRAAVAQATREPSRGGAKP